MVQWFQLSTKRSYILLDEWKEKADFYVHFKHYWGFDISTKHPKITGRNCWKGCLNKSEPCLRPSSFYSNCIFTSFPKIFYMIKRLALTFQFLLIISLTNFVFPPFTSLIIYTFVAIISFYHLVLTYMHIVYAYIGHISNVCKES